MPSFRNESGWDPVADQVIWTFLALCRLIWLISAWPVWACSLLQRPPKHSCHKSPSASNNLKIPSYYLILQSRHAIFMLEYVASPISPYITSPVTCPVSKFQIVFGDLSWMVRHKFGFLLDCYAWELSLMSCPNAMLSCGVIIGVGKHFYLEVFLIFGLLKLAQNVSSENKSLYSLNSSQFLQHALWAIYAEARFMVGLKVSASEKIENVQSVCNLISNNCILCQFLWRGSCQLENQVERCWRELR